MFNTIIIEQGANAWHELRAKRIGSSDIPAIMGVAGAYKKRAELLKEKITGETKPVDAFTQSLFDLGHEIEIETRCSFNAATGKTFVPLVAQSIENDYFIASLDGADLEHKEIIEIKSTRKDDYLALASDNKIPELYNVQMQWQFFVTGFHSGYCLVVDSRDKKAHVVEVRRDDILIGIIKIAAEQFLKEMSCEVVPYVQLETKEMIDIAATMKMIRTYKKEIKKAEFEIKQQAEELLERYGALSIDGAGVVIDYETRIGSIQYDLIPELKNVDLNKYRKESTKSPRIKEKKVKELE